MVEIWKPVPGYEGLYEISDLGGVRSLYFDPPRTLTHGENRPNGYPTIMLSKSGKRKPHTVHRLVARAFQGRKQNALHCEVAHLDGDIKNPRADNLKWVSKVENESHKRRHGTRHVGESSPSALLTGAAVVDIIRLLAKERWSCRRAANKYGVSQGTVESIRRGRNWRHIQRPPEFSERWDGGRNQRGAHNHMAKLSWDDVQQVRERYRNGESCPSIARSFGISRAAAHKAAVGQTYSAQAPSEGCQSGPERDRPHSVLVR